MEADTIHKVQEELGNIQQSSWSSISDDLFFPKDKVYKDGEQVGIARCIGTVQTSPERLLGWNFNFELDYRIVAHVKRNGPNASQYPNIVVVRINNHYAIFYCCRKMPFPLVARDFFSRAIFS